MPIFFCLNPSVSFATEIKPVPRAAKKYRRLLVRSAHVYWGLDAPIPYLAGQIKQESNWKPTAKSWAGAEGLSQFMPATAKWWSKKAGLGVPKVTKPTWAFRAQASYMKWLYDRSRANDICNKFGLTTMAYNGGESWVRRDQKLAVKKGLDPANYKDVGLVNAGRKKSAKRENRMYPILIIEKHAPAYIAAGWGESICQ
ncbi:MAG: transglycosylase SLT domain-containing protein [Desulfotalea sp.]